MALARAGLKFLNSGRIHINDGCWLEGTIPYPQRISVGFKASAQLLPWHVTLQLRRLTGQTRGPQFDTGMSVRQESRYGTVLTRKAILYYCYLRRIQYTETRRCTTTVQLRVNPFSRHPLAG
jgi:hypothetical protein